jgi:hypothetical protein
MASEARSSSPGAAAATPAAARAADRKLEHEGTYTCGVCLGLVVENLQCITCKHLFCVDCLGDWLKSETGNKLCPTVSRASFLAVLILLIYSSLMEPVPRGRKQPESVCAQRGADRRRRKVPLQLRAWLWRDVHPRGAVRLSSFYVDAEYSAATHAHNERLGSDLPVCAQTSRCNGMLLISLSLTLAQRGALEGLPRTSSGVSVRRMWRGVPAQRNGPAHIQLPL